MDPYYFSPPKELIMELGTVVEEEEESERNKTLQLDQQHSTGNGDENQDIATDGTASPKVSNIKNAADIKPTTVSKGISNEGMIMEYDESDEEVHGGEICNVTENENYKNNVNLQALSSAGTFGEIKVKNSKEVHFGNNIYTAPVTIEAPTDEVNWRDNKKLTNMAAILCCVAFLAIVWTLVIAVVIVKVTSADEDLPEDIFLNETWFHPRTFWHATPPRERSYFTPPVPCIIIGDEKTFACSTTKSCAEVILKMQRLTMAQRGFDDLPFNYLVGGDPEGGIFVGRGSHIIGQHSGGVNLHSIIIKFLGNYNVLTPKPNQIQHVEILIAKMIEEGKLKEDYILNLQSQVTGLESPGKNLADEFKTWPRYTTTRCPQVVF